MSVLIDGIPMPKDCRDCCFKYESDATDRLAYCYISGCWTIPKDSERAEVCLLKETQPEQPEPQWIPCSDKIPSESQECWITAKDGTVCQGMFTRQYGERRDSGFICNGFGFVWLNAVAAWMPYEMPEPYQEEGE